MAIIDQRSDLTDLVAFSTLPPGQVYETSAETLYQKIAADQAVILDGTWIVSTPSPVEQVRTRAWNLVIED